MTTSGLLQIRDLSVALPGNADRTKAVDGVDLDLRRGEIHCVVGESGSGKSMLSYAVMGLLPLGLTATGTVAFENRNLLTLGEPGMRALRGSKISMIFQEPMTALNPSYTVANQVCEVYRAHRSITGRDALLQATEALRSAGLVDTRRILASHPHQLSGGQRQRVMIAMALALEPSVLIADEPTTALDVTTQAQILALIRRLQNEHDTGVLFITHDFGVVAEIANRVTVMRDGRVVETGAMQDVLLRPQDSYTRELIGAVPRLRVRPARPLTAQTVLSVTGVTKTFRERTRFFKRPSQVTALNAVSLSLQTGETLGIVGESGSGKSTLARSLVQFTRIDSGAITIEGQDISAMRGAGLKAMRRKIQMVFQDPYASLDRRRRVADILCEGPQNFGVSRRAAMDGARELVRRVGLPESAIGRFPHEFSGGQRQRICIARALSVRPDILVADEAVSALDVSVQRRILDLLVELKAEYKLSVVFITHDLRVAAEICDTIVVMRNGEVVEQGTAHTILTAHSTAYTGALVAAIPGQSMFGYDKPSRST